MQGLPVVATPHSCIGTDTRKQNLTLYWEHQSPNAIKFLPILSQLLCLNIVVKTACSAFRNLPTGGATFFFHLNRIIENINRFAHFLFAIYTNMNKKIQIVFITFTDHHEGKHSVSYYPRFMSMSIRHEIVMRIGTNTKLKTDSFAVFESFLPPLVSTTPRYLNFSTCCSVFPRTCSAQWRGFLDRHNTSVF